MFNNSIGYLVSMNRNLQTPMLQRVYCRLLHLAIAKNGNVRQLIFSEPAVACGRLSSCNN